MLTLQLASPHPHPSTSSLSRIFPGLDLGSLVAQSDMACLNSHSLRKLPNDKPLSLRRTALSSKSAWLEMLKLARLV
jgi:hypothetical protein